MFMCEKDTHCKPLDYFILSGFIHVLNILTYCVTMRMVLMRIGIQETLQLWR
jgi:hypothetical protein